MLGENCIKIISDKPNSLGTFLGIQSEIYMSGFLKMVLKNWSPNLDFTDL